MIGGSGPSAGGADCTTVLFDCVQVAAGQPVTVGTLLATSGDEASLGTDSQHGVRLAIDNLDGALDGTMGQLLGHDVSLQNEDDGCSAAGGRAGAQALASNDQVVGVIGTSCPSAALGVADQILSDKGILLISPSNTDPRLTSEAAHQPFSFRTAYNDEIQGAIVSDFVYAKLGLTSVATIDDGSPYAAALAHAFADNFQAAGGTITASEKIKSAETDFKPLLATIALGNPQALYFPDLNPACALIAKQARGIMPGVVLIGSDGCLASDFLKTAGSAADGVYASSPDLSVFASGDFYQNQFLPAYESEFGAEPTSAFHAQAYDATNILFEAIKKVAVTNPDGSLTIPRTALKDALSATSDYQGITGTITCMPLGDCATNVTIAVYQAPDWPVDGGNPDSMPVFSETRSLADVI